MKYEQPTLPIFEDNLVDLNRARAERRARRFGKVSTRELFFREQQLMSQGDTTELRDVSDELNQRSDV